MATEIIYTHNLGIIEKYDFAKGDIYSGKCWNHLGNRVRFVNRYIRLGYD